MIQQATKIKPTFICSANSPRWLELRNQGIGASEAAAACGISNWQTPLELYHRKRGQLPPIEENRAMRLGKKLEPIIASEFELETGLKVAVREPGLWASSESPHILATPDAMLSEDELLEIKTMNDRRAWEELGEEGTDEIPFEWNMQAQQQMYVMGASVCWFAVLVGGQDLRVFAIHRHDKAIAGLCRKLTEFWQRIESGQEPEFDPNHKTALQLAKELYGEVESGEVITLSTEAADAWEQYEDCTQQAGVLKKRADAAKAQVLMELESAEAGQLPDGRFVKRSVVNRKGYTVEPSSYVTCRAVKKL